MNIGNFLRCLLLLTASTLSSYSQPSPPNIIVILADDLGYGDLSCYGHPTIRTPNLDRMALEGMRFTQFYVGAAVCSPSRAALLTGRLAVRTGIYGKKNGVFRQNAASGLPLEEITVAELLKDAGYTTGIIGKWHLGHLQKFLPLDQGFNYWFGTPYSNDMGLVYSTRGNTSQSKRPNAVPLPLFRNREIIEEEPDQHYLTQRYTEEAIRFIKRSKNEKKPFFLYYASNFPHTPLYASPAFEGKSKRGLYGDVVAELDWSVGEVLKTLRDLQLDSNTLVIFTSDNGPWLTKLDHGGSAGILYEGKQSTYEGGMRVPAIARWPGKIPPNSISAELASTLDFLPTFAALSRGSLPKDRILDGFDISGLLFHKKVGIRNTMYYYFNDQLYAIRKGVWKAHFITHPSYSRELPVVHKPPLLYNIDVDPSEKYNVAKDHPAIVEELLKAYEMQNKIVPVPPELDKLL